MSNCNASLAFVVGVGRTFISGFLRHFCSIPDTHTVYSTLNFQHFHIDLILNIYLFKQTTLKLQRRPAVSPRIITHCCHLAANRSLAARLFVFGYTS